MGAQQVALVTGEPMPTVLLIPPSLDTTALLGIAFVQIISASLIGALMGRTYRWSWLSGGDGIILSNTTGLAVTLTSLSLVPVVRTGVLQLEVISATVTRAYQIPVTVRHQ